ncbi:hypothetical protein ABS768_14430 [Flavobacterium sp. ST-75]|uniref:Tox-MPTase3 domain-containing protein n=1 Tax=Flavobacterium rhizophilum TaxID=3163296 RepID=A0ABW8YFL1_9FLAO
MITTVTILFGCQNDYVNTDSTNTTHSHTTEPKILNLNQVISEITNDKILESLNKFKESPSILKNNFPDFENGETYFEKFEFPELIQYQAYLKGIDRKDSVPYVLNYLITKDIKNGLEYSGYIKYIPTIIPEDNTIQIRNFTGTMQLLSDDMIQVGEVIYDQGNMVSNTFGTTTCYTEIVQVTHVCSNGGNHTPGEDCQPGYINDASYSYFAVTTCTTEFDYHTPPNFIGGGGGATMTEVEKFYSLKLNNDQRAFLDQNSTVKNKVFEYIERTGSFITGVRLVDISRNNNQLSNSLFNYLEVNNYSLNSTRAISEIANYVTRTGQITQEKINTGINMINSLNNNTALSISPFFKYPTGSNYATLYPKLTEYLKFRIPQLKYNQFIIDKLVQYSELPESQVIEDLQWGVGPEIQIVQLDNACPTCSTTTYGMFDPTTPNVLYVDVDFANLLENSEPGQEGNTLAFLIGVTLLHEYVHLGDFVDGIDQPGEEGILFEEATYGESIWITNAGRVLCKWEND